MTHPDVEAIMGLAETWRDLCAITGYGKDAEDDLRLAIRKLVEGRDALNYLVELYRTNETNRAEQVSRAEAEAAALRKINPADRERAKESIKQIGTFLAEAPIGKPHTRYRYGALLAEAVTLLRKAYLP